MDPGWTARRELPARAEAISGDWRKAAARAAAAVEGRAQRPIFLGDGRGEFNERGLGYACGAAAARRSIVVGLSLSAYYPSASLSERVLAVAHFRRWGWRVFLVLH